MEKVDCATRKKILDAALKQFAHCGYSGASVQSIVDSANVTKPTLYYYFPSKAALYKALVDSAHEERYRLIQDSAQLGGNIEEKLVEILTALFSFMSNNHELVRVVFSSAFAAPGELPPELNYGEKARRNFELVQNLIKDELDAGRMNKDFDSEELAYNFWGLMNIYIMTNLILFKHDLNRTTATRIVKLFLAGAAKEKS